MNEKNDAEAFAATVLDTMGPTETLLMSMRLVLLVAQRTPEDERVLAVTKEAISAIKRVGVTAGLLLPS